MYTLNHVQSCIFLKVVDHINCSHDCVPEVSIISSCCSTSFCFLPTGYSPNLHTSLNGVCEKCKVVKKLVLWCPENLRIVRQRRVRISDRQNTDTTQSVSLWHLFKQWKILHCHGKLLNNIMCNTAEFSWTVSKSYKTVKNVQVSHGFHLKPPDRFSINVGHVCHQHLSSNLPTVCRHVSPSEHLHLTVCHFVYMWP